MSEHEMHYRAGSIGLGGIGVRDSSPHWFCPCDGWRFAAKSNPRTVTGNNRKAAERSHREHVAQMVEEIAS